jgi:site-specific DNA-methyltransferase (adenine-specific)
MLGAVDLVVTDPPYGLRSKDTNKNKYKSFTDDPGEVTETVRFIIEMYKNKRVVLTPGQNLMFKYPEPDAIGAFYYPAGTGSCSWGFVGWQPIFYYGKDPYLAAGKGRRMNSKASTEQAEKNGHPCPKPLNAWKWLVSRCSFPGETILDPFAGSGTTGRAAKDIGRKCIMIEIEEMYCEIIAKRMSQCVLDFKS